MIAPDAHLLPIWRQIAQAAEQKANPEDTRDVGAVLAAYMMVDALESGRRIPTPTPELNAKLARAEVLAQSA